MFGKKYQDKVERIEGKVDCSHHPESALKLILEDDWTASDEINLTDLHDNDGLGIIPRTWVDYLSPRQRAAYETTRKTAMSAAFEFYFLGRLTRNRLDGKRVYANWNSLDRKFVRSFSRGCAQECFEKAYAVEYPLSASLDTGIGFIAGVVTSPVSFTLGVLYTPVKVPQIPIKEIKREDL